MNKIFTVSVLRYAVRAVLIYSYKYNNIPNVIKKKCLFTLLQEDIEVGQVRIKHKKTEDEKQQLIENIEDKK